MPQDAKQTGWSPEGDDQPSLFDDGKAWTSEWQDMPEFVQPRQNCFAEIVFRFETEDDLARFAQLIDQKLTSKTKSAWFPFRSHWHGVKKEWTDRGEDEP